MTKRVIDAELVRELAERVNRAGVLAVADAIRDLLPGEEVSIFCKYCGDITDARDAEIADLKRQLAERDALIEDYPRLFTDKQMLDAYVQKKVQERMAQEFKEYLERVRQYEIEWQTKLDRAVLAESEWWHSVFVDQYDDHNEDCIGCVRVAANRAKVKDADQPKEK